MAMMSRKEREALKRQVLAMFRRAEIRCIQGKNRDSLHNPRIKRGVKHLVWLAVSLKLPKLYIIGRFIKFIFY